MDKDRKRERVSKACVYCRKRKIKCDGLHPCANCRNNGLDDCVYPTNKIRKPRSTKAQLNHAKQGTEVSKLEKRLDNLEHLLADLTSTLKESQKTAPIAMHKPVETHVVPKELSRPKALMKPKSYLDERSHYIGPHSAFSIFTGKSLLWIRKSLGESHKHALLPVDNFESQFHESAGEFINHVWDEVVVCDQMDDYKGFPKDENLVWALLELYDQLYLYSYMCEGDQIRSLFKEYFKDRAGERNLKYNNSDLIIMFVSLSACICQIPGISESDEVVIKVNISNDSDSEGTEIAEFTASTEVLKKMKENLMKGSIQAYGRVSLFSEGVITMQALLLMMIFLELGPLKTHSIQTLLSLAIRFAIDLGLHRSESYMHLSSKERLLRKRLWYYCIYYDWELCFRYGTLPMTALEEAYWEDENFKSILPDILIRKNQVSLEGVKPEILVSEKCFHSYCNYHLLLLTKIKRKTYFDLYSQVALKSDFMDLVFRIDNLNSSMLELVEGIDKNFRPVFYDDPDFEPMYDFQSRGITEEVDSGSINLLVLHLTVLSHMMLINRLPFQTEYRDKLKDVPNIAKIRNYHLKSARTILFINEIAAAVSEDTNKLIMNWLSVHAFTAYLNLVGYCIMFPESEDAHVTMDSLISYALKCFVLRINDGDCVAANDHFKICLVGLIAKIMLNVCFILMTMKGNYRYKGDINQLLTYFESAKIDFPELYNAKNQQTKSHAKQKQPLGNISPSNSSRGYVSPLKTDSTSSVSELDPSGYSNDSAGCSNLLFDETYNSLNLGKTIPDNIINGNGSEMLHDYMDEGYDDALNRFLPKIYDISNIFFDNGFSFT